MRTQQLRDLQSLLGQPTPAPTPSPQQELREAGDNLLREFLGLTDWDHPAAERWRQARAAVEDFGAEG